MKTSQNSNKDLYKDYTNYMNNWMNNNEFRVGVLYFFQLWIRRFGKLKQLYYIGGEETSKEEFPLSTKSESIIL